MKPIEYIEIGFIKKAHGTKGHVYLIIDEFLQDLKSKMFFFTKSGSQYLPYYVEEIQSGNKTILKIEEIDSPEAATKITKSKIYLRKEDISNLQEKLEAADNTHPWIGFTIIDKDEEIGKIVGIEEFPHQIMSFVARKDEEIMIPIPEELIIEINNSKKTIFMNLPEGLINL